MDRKKSVGLYIAALSVILALVGMIAYLMNTRTNYYAQMGVDSTVLLCLIAAIVLTVVRILIGLKGTPMIADILPVCAAAVLTIGLVMLLNVRINNLAAVFTFENSAANMADTTSCIIAIAGCLLAVIFSIISAFFDITKEKA